MLNFIVKICEKGDDVLWYIGGPPFDDITLWIYDIKDVFTVDQLSFWICM